MTKSKKRTIQGVVVSNKMDKTLVVRVERTRTHSKYHKQYKVSKKYKVHDPNNEYQVGDKVLFREGRPMSRGKRWKVVTKL